MPTHWKSSQASKMLQMTHYRGLSTPTVKECNMLLTEESPSPELVASCLNMLKGKTAAESKALHAKLMKITKPVASKPSKTIFNKTFMQKLKEFAVQHKIPLATVMIAAIGSLWYLNRLPPNELQYTPGATNPETRPPYDLYDLGATNVPNELSVQYDPGATNPETRPLLYDVDVW